MCRNFFSVLAFCLLFVSCKKTEDSVTELADNLLVLRTDQAVDITGNSALGKGYIKVNGSTSVSEYGVCWSTGPNPTISSSKKIYTGGLGSFSCPITGLNLATTYYVRSYATVRLSGSFNSFTAYGNQVQFTTLAAGLPTLSTKGVSISGTNASSGGDIFNTGGSAITERGVCWSTNPNPNINLSTKTKDGPGSGSFTSNIYDLSIGNTYYVKAYATNSVGTAYGNTLSFTTTSSAACPSLTTTSVSAISSTSASSGGNVSNSGGAIVTTRGICYSSVFTSPNISNGTVVTSGSGTGLYIITLNDLSPGTTYYVRAFATNSAGTCYGNQVSFTTSSCPTLVTDINGNTYQTKSIGSQCWLTSNLKVTKYKNGVPITTDLSNSSWASTSAGAYSTGSSSCGHLYNWYAVNNSQGLCPAGWHVPSKAEWENLIQYLGFNAGAKLKATSFGGSNESGFSALPCGQRYGYDGNYNNIGYDGYWWTSTISSGNGVWNIGLSGINSNVSVVYYNTARSGLSVRCIKD
jgi:uncharacterized protein (TIGR02145 family)